jgi:glycogen debranching enzyme
MTDHTASQHGMQASENVPVFYIPATASLQERRPRTLKHGETFAVFDHNGDIVQGLASPEGLFHADTRHLSRSTLTLGGRRPLLLSSTLRADNATLTCDLTNPDLFEGERLVLEHDIIHIRRTKFLWQGGCYERLGISNYSSAEQQLNLQLSVGADFADLFEVRGSRRERRGILHEPEIGPDQVLFMPTGDSRQVPSRSSKCKPMSTPRSAWRRRSPAHSGSNNTQPASINKLSRFG